MHPIWLIAVLLVATPFIAREYRARRRQRRELVALARRRNLKYSPVDLIGLHDRYHNLELIRRGHGRHAWNVLYGSADTGLIAVFRYSYDLGFGVQQVPNQCWVAVLESPQAFETWQAEPVSATPSGASEGMTRIGPFHVRAARTSTLKLLTAPLVTASLISMPDTAHTEVRGPLIAIACAAQNDPSIPDRLIDALLALAGALTTRDASPTG